MLRKILIIVTSLLLAAFCVFLSVLYYRIHRYFSYDWNYDLSTVMATDPNIAAMGECGFTLDCFDAVPITPENAISVGSPVKVGKLQVTVTYTEIVTSSTLIDPTYPNNALLLIEYIVQNNSPDDVRYIAPESETQLQGLFVEFKRAASDPKATEVVIELAPGEKYYGEMAYVIRKDDVNIYWVYRDRMSGEQAEFKVR